MDELAGDFGSCPHCAYRFDAFTPIGGSSPRPQPGSWGLCFRCGYLMIFTETVTRLATAQDLKGLDRHNGELLARAIAAWHLNRMGALD